tara:strand:- start:155868 stop:156095 length:228 start_codon:yes stop_codon:yes gene_type:complete
MTSKVQLRDIEVGEAFAYGDRRAKKHVYVYVKTGDATCKSFGRIVGPRKYESEYYDKGHDLAVQPDSMVTSVVII